MSDDLVKQRKVTEGEGCPEASSLIKWVVETELAKHIEELEAELHLMKTSGIIEVAVRNPNVMEYMRHWEGRAEAAEAKLAKAVGLLEAWINVATHCTIEEGVCCCGDNMDTHANPMDCGHSPVDHGAYVAMGLVEKTNTTLAELTGGKDE